MTSSILPSVGELAAAAALTVLIVTIAAVGGALWLRGRIRRLRRTVSASVAQWAHEMGADLLGSRPALDRRWIGLHRSRRRLARARAGATRAVNSARAAGAPLGDLESVLGRLTASADGVDTSLAIAQRSSKTGVGDAGIVSQADALAEGARRIEQAALASLEATSAPAITTLVDDVHRETEAVRAGMTVADAAMAASPALSAGHSQFTR